MSMLQASPASAALQSEPPIDRDVPGLRLGQELKEAKNARSLYELRWLDDPNGGM